MVALSDPAVRERGLWISAWHPVRLAGQGRWEFPCQLHEAEKVKADFIYNFVLDREKQSLVMGAGIEVAVLGHCFQDDEVIRHEYYGTARVVDDLRQAPGWADGLVTQDVTASALAQIALVAEPLAQNLGKSASQPAPQPPVCGCI